MTVIVAAFFVTGGHINVDEGVYHLMVRDYVSTGRFRLWNGYEEFASAELAYPVTPSREGHLVSQYPQLYAILAAPLYALMGYRALFLINAIALVGALWLTVWLARCLFPDKAIGAISGMIFALSTYAWDYAFAAMPHGLSVLCVLGAVFFAVQAYNRLEYRSSLLFTLAAGLIVGFSVGIRLDTVFVLPALVVPFLFFTPWRPGHVLTILLGLLPGLALMAVVNHEKFGQFNPFSYGQMVSGNAMGLTPYLSIAAVGTAALAISWFVTRPRFQPLVHANRRRFGLALAAFGLSVVLVPPLSALSGKLIGGVFQLIVDLRVRDLGITEPGLSRGPGGGMIYLGALKKSLLQSCPYLVCLIVPAWALFREPQDRRAIAILFLVPLTYVGIYGFFAWHGGQGLNLRYFLPILPFISILTAYALRELTENHTEKWDRWFSIVGLCLFAVYAVLVFTRHPDISEQEIIYLTFPLLLSAFLLVLVLFHVTGVRFKARGLEGLTILVLCAAVFWPRIVTFAYDLPKSYQTRELRADFARTAMLEVAQDSLIFVTSADPFFELLDHPRVRIAVPARDDFHDFEQLSLYHIAAGRPVYAWLDPPLRSELQQRRIWSRIRYQSLLENEHGELIKILGFREP